MGSLTNYSETELLDHVCNAAYSPPSNIYLGLATADPTDAATGASCNECADSGSYARTEITFGAAASRRVTQDADVTFPTASGSWGTVTHWFIADSATHGAGNVLAHGAFSSSKTISNGNTPSVASGQIYVEFSAGEISDYLAGKLLDLMFNATAYSVPDTYIALTTATIADNDDGDTITEPGSGAYARVQVNINGGASPTWDTAVSGDPSYVDNGDQIDFPQATGSWGTITSVAVLDAATSGNLLFYDNTMADQAVATNDIVQFLAGDLDLQMS